MPVFAVDSCFARPTVRVSRGRRVSREAGFVFTRAPPELRRLADEARLGAPVERFEVRVVALRVADPDPASAADLDVPCERCDLVAVLATVRGGLVPGRALAPRTLPDLSPRTLPDLSPLGLFAGVDGLRARATFFGARPLAAGFPLLAALAPSVRSLLVDVGWSFRVSLRVGCDGPLRVRAE